jgi:hypothetical protein
MSGNRMLHMMRDPNNARSSRCSWQGLAPQPKRNLRTLVLGLITTLIVLGSIAEVADAQQLLRGIPGAPALPSNNRAGPGSSSVQSRPAAPPPGQFAPAPNPGPVTGYGPGGIGHLPGTPINPPYR